MATISEIYDADVKFYRINSKLAKGGVVVGLADRFKLPVHAVGVGEGLEDLQPFTARDYARSLVGLL